MLHFKNTVSALLLFALVFSSVACSSHTTDPVISVTDHPATDTDTTIDENIYEPLDLPSDLDYGGRRIVILTEPVNPYINGEITVEDLISEPVNDSVYNRELFVEELLDVEIEQYPLENGRGIFNYLSTMTIAGDSPGDIACVTADAAIWNSEIEIFAELMDMPLLDLGQPWWFQDYTKAASIGDHLFTCCGDLSLSLKRCIFVLFLNKRLAEDEGIENLYQTVFEGKWTLDKLMEVTSGIYHDMNGDSVADFEDQYGYITSETSVDPFWSAFDIPLFRKDEGNYLEYCLNTDKFFTATAKVNTLFEARSTLDVGWPEDDLYQLFASDGGLIAITRLLKVETPVMRNMQSEYGILPLPKYDESQKDYYTMPSDRYTCFAIPVLVEDSEASAAVLDAMSWYSYRYVTPAYFDVALKGKYSNDPETRRMIDIINEGFTVDAGWVSASRLSDFPQIWRYIVNGEYDSGASAVAAKERRIQILIRAYNSLFDQYD